MFDFADPLPARRPSLTPMIDVVFLLLVFFMLVSQVGREGGLPLSAAGAGAPYQGPPRLVGIAPGAITLNGRPVALDRLAEALSPLTEGPADAILLRTTDGATLQHLTDVTDALTAAGFARLVLVE
ncbi:biopolymer transporter ExbD [Actibacterium sp. MT2.3-13A]|uniref:ExbD/TolR family protein n=1 Tax=Actibacterium sp. MT2.3-13A TaxID=2828332 RepID=UPI001BA58625|nr:biopolymer transporter ExbD [Actibacterium sp. MT2.3-13A]